MKPSRTSSDDAGKTGTDLFSTAVQEQLRRVVASDSFRNSRSMTNLLRFVVSETLAGNEHRLKEYVIAVEVFGRDKSFDPRTNAVVRVEASRLRHRLWEYFLGPGRGDRFKSSCRSEATFRSSEPRRLGQRRRRADFVAAPQEASLALPDRPSIVVLPFVFLGEDQRRQCVADGMAEELTTALSRIHWLHVSARTSAFAHKGWAADVKHVVRNLGVRYALEGSVRQVGNRIRVFARFIEPSQAVYCPLSDMIVSWMTALCWRRRSLRGSQRPFNSSLRRLSDSELCAVHPKSDAWGLYQRGVAHMHRFTSRTAGVPSSSSAGRPRLIPSSRRLVGLSRTLPFSIFPGLYRCSG